MLVARDFDGRSDAELSYLTENDLPITVLRVVVYEDQDERRFIDVGADHEIDLPVGDGAGRTAPTRYEIDGRRIAVSDLLDAGLLDPDTPVTWSRPRIGASYSAAVLGTGQIRLDHGRTFASPSRAARRPPPIFCAGRWRQSPTAAHCPTCGASCRPRWRLEVLSHDS